MNNPSPCVLKRSPPRSRQKRAEKRSLELLLLTATFLSSLTGISSTRVQNPQEQRLNGILGGSVLLPADILPAEKLSTIEWDFLGGNGTGFLLAALREGKLQKLNARFGPRLDLANETTLRIRDLEMNDSGKYSIKVRFISTKYTDYTYHLSVYEPVPEPNILYRDVSNSPDGCNVTLECVVSGKGQFNISWETGDAFRDVEDGSKSYHLSDNGKDLHLFWKAHSSEPSITCVFSNPADQKSSSFNLLHICQTEVFKGDHQLDWWWIFLIIFFVISLLLLAAFGIKTWKKRRKMSPNKAASMMPTEEILPELQYSEVVKRCPPEGDDDQEPTHFHDPAVSSPSVYALLQLPAHHSEQVT